MSSKVNNLSWSDRFAIIDQFDPTDQQICATFNVTMDELAMARELLDAGTFSISRTIDVDSYEGIFTEPASHERTVHRITRRPVMTTHDGNIKPATATQRTTTTKKRGRKGTRVVEAFKNVPTEPTSAEEFAAKHNVSIATLRQGTRFDTTGLPGAVRVKKDKETKELMIWRESDSE